MFNDPESVTFEGAEWVTLSIDVEYSTEMKARREY